jgi:hypothetical protein
MRDAVEHSVKILADGSAITTLDISRTHTGVKGSLFSGVRNVDYVRVYAPAGSTLIEATGFTPPDPKLFKIAKQEYTDDPVIAAEEDGATTDNASGTRVSSEDGFTVFGNWIQTDPGTTTKATLVYALPAGIVRTSETQGAQLSYSLHFQKQAGIRPLKFTSHIDVPRGFRLFSQSPERTEEQPGFWTFSDTLKNDFVLHSTFEKN